MGNFGCASLVFNSVLLPQLCKRLRLISLLACRVVILWGVFNLQIYGNTW